MSTTFEVYPGHSHRPSFGELLSAANRHLSARLTALNSSLNAQINVEMRQCADDALAQLDYDDSMNWPDDSYAWFAVDNVVGGTDAYYDSVDELTREVWADYLKQDRLNSLSETVNQCLAVGHYWTFRRSAGQPGVINLVYGLLAGSLAELTDGIVFSDDSAWVWDLLPIAGDEFLKRYFATGGTSNAEAEEWTKRCLGWIPQELSG